MMGWSTRGAALSAVGALLALTVWAGPSGAAPGDPGARHPRPVGPPVAVEVGDDGVVVPTAVNDRGQVVGYHVDDVANEDRDAFVWQDGVTTDLGTESWQPCDVNNRGEVVGDGHPVPAFHWDGRTLTVMADESTATRVTEHGWSGGVRTEVTPERYGPTVAYLWRDGVRTDLDLDPQITEVYPTYGCGNENSDPGYVDVNDHGTFLGRGRTADGADASFLVERGRVRVLRDRSGTLLGLDLNDRGQVAGAVRTPTGGLEAAIWTDGRILPLGVPSPAAGWGTWATAINERGDVVIDVPGERALVRQRGVLTPLGPEGATSTAHAINDAGQVAGILDRSEDPATSQAFVWERGVLTRLGEAGEGVQDVVDLSERGHVLAHGHRLDSEVAESYALLWTVPPRRR